MAKRTINNCKLIKDAVKHGIGYPTIDKNKCLGYAGNTDEPCEICKKCRLNIVYNT